MSGLGRLRAVATTALSCAVVTVVATTAWAAPVAADPATVKANPAVFEVAPRSLGSSFAWLRSDSTRSRSLDSLGTKPLKGDFLVQGDGQRMVKLNERGTISVGGALVPGGALYSQQRGTKPPRFLKYDLRTRKRMPLPDAVNLSRFRGERTRILGDVSASGPWLLFTRRTPNSREGIPLEQAALYNRTTRDLRVVGGALTDHSTLWAGQVNGNWVTYSDYSTFGTGGFFTQVVRVNIETGRAQSFRESDFDDDSGTEPNPVSVWAPAVASDGTWYHWRSTRDPADSDVEPTNELVRVAAGGGRSVVATLTGSVPEDTFVRGTGSATQVFYSVDGDIFRLDL